MKKLFLLCFTLLIIIPIFAKAETCNSSDVVIDSITRDIVSDTSIEKESPKIDGTKINLNLNFTEEGNFIKYVLVIKNNSKNDYVLNNDKINTKTDYVEYDIKSVDNNDIIKPGESKSFVLTIIYTKEVDETKFENGIFNDNKTISFDLIGVENNVPNPDTGINNPLIRIIILLVIVSLLYLLLRKNKYKKYMVLLLVLIPISIEAVCKCNISFDSTTVILKNNYLYTTSINKIYIGDTISLGDPLYKTYGEAIDNYGYNYYIRHLIDNNNKVIASYVGFIKDGNNYYIQGGDSGEHFEESKNELLKIFGIDNCTELDGDFICVDYNSKLDIIISNDGFVEVGEEETSARCKIQDNNNSFCTDNK